MGSARHLLLFLWACHLILTCDSASYFGKIEYSAADCLTGKEASFTHFPAKWNDEACHFDTIDGKFKKFVCTLSGAQAMACPATYGNCDCPDSTSTPVDECIDVSASVKRRIVCENSPGVSPLSGSVTSASCSAKKDGLYFTYYDRCLNLFGTPAKWVCNATAEEVNLHFYGGATCDGAPLFSTNYPTDTCSSSDNEIFACDGFDDCSALPSRPHATFDCTPPVALGDSCNMTCAGTRVKTGDPVCTDTYWSFEECVETQCAAPPTATANMTLTCAPPYYVGDTCGYSCDGDLKKGVATVFTCLESGLWDENGDQSCEVPTCASAPSVPHGSVDCGGLPPFPAGHNCSVSCDSGREASSSVATCLLSGAFTVETCTDIDGCAGDPCRSEGDALATCADAAAPAVGHTCTCSAGYSPPNCVDTDGCIGHDCGENDDAGATCVDNPAPATGYTCSCSDGYYSSPACTPCEEVANAAVGASYTCSSAATSRVSACATGFYKDSLGAADRCRACTPVDNATPGAISCTSAETSRVEACQNGYYKVSDGDADVCSACTPVEFAKTGTAIQCSNGLDSQVGECRDGYAIDDSAYAPGAGAYQCVVDESSEGAVVASGGGTEGGARAGAGMDAASAAALAVSLAVVCGLAVVGGALLVRNARRKKRLDEIMGSSTPDETALVAKDKDLSGFLMMLINGKAPFAKGGFGAVYKVSTGGETMALKVLESNLLDAREEFHRENHMLTRLGEKDSGLVIGLTCFCSTPEFTAIGMPYAAGGSLRNLLARMKPNFNKASAVALRTAKCIAFVHENGVFHGDIKPANFLVMGDGSIVLCDFGTAFALKDQAKGIKDFCGAGSPHYLAPERYGLAQLPPGSMQDMYFKAMDLPKADVFSFGIMMWAITTTLNPYDEETAADIPRKVATDNEFRPPFDENVPTWYADLAALCWSHEAKDRPVMKDVVTNLENLVKDSDATMVVGGINAAIVDSVAKDQNYSVDMRSRPEDSAGPRPENGGEPRPENGGEPRPENGGEPRPENGGVAAQSSMPPLPSVSSEANLASVQQS